MLNTVKTYSLNEYNFTVIDGNLKIIKKSTHSNAPSSPLVATLCNVPSSPLVAPSTPCNAPSTSCNALLTPCNAPSTPCNAPSTPCNAPSTPVKAPKKRDNDNVVSVMYCIKRYHSDPTNHTPNKKTKTNNNPSNKRDDINNKVSLPFPIFDPPIFDFKSNSDIINNNSNIINTNSNIINAPLRQFNKCIY